LGDSETRAREMHNDIADSIVVRRIEMSSAENEMISSRTAIFPY
jgi:hypothetical protein